MTTSEFVSGNWVVRDGSEVAFVDAWSRFLTWTRDRIAGLRWAILLQDAGDDQHFVSIAEWDTRAHRDAWRTDPEFAPHLGSCRALCEEFRAADYSLAAAVDSVTGATP